jgi:hypothetical protein
MPRAATATAAMQNLPTLPATRAATTTRTATAAARLPLPQPLPTLRMRLAAATTTPAAATHAAPAHRAAVQRLPVHHRQQPGGVG